MKYTIKYDGQGCPTLSPQSTEGETMAFDHLKQLTLLIFLFFAASAWGTSDVESERAKEVVEKSRQTRTNIEKGLSRREIASIDKDTQKWHQEYKTLMASDDDQDWFKQVDQVINER